MAGSRLRILLAPSSIGLAAALAIALSSGDAAGGASAPRRSPARNVQLAPIVPVIAGRRGPMAHIASPAVRRADLAIGRSLGSPTEGKLLGGMHVEEAPYLRIVPAYADGDVRWGTAALVRLIDDAARSVRRQFPDAVLSLGHLSRSGGGEVERHASHESGRDADIGFYVKNWAGKPIYAEHFVAFRPDGTAPSWPGAQFDDARNWALVAALVSDGRARVSHIFVEGGLRTRLLTYAEHVGAPYAVRRRASEVMAQPRGALPHDDHFHVRIMCPMGMTECIEQPTRHPLAMKRRSHVPGGHDVDRAMAGAPAVRGTAPSSPILAPARGKRSPPGNDTPHTAHAPDETPPLPRFVTPPLAPEESAEPPIAPSPSVSEPSLLLPEPVAPMPPSAPGDDIDDS